MTTVNTTTTPKMGRLSLGTTPATSPSTLVRRLAIEAALSDALHLVRTSDTQHGIQAATGRAIRLHEHSRFVRENDRWYYLDGDIAP